jgi:dihydrofolate reductase
MSRREVHGCPAGKETTMRKLMVTTFLTLDGVMQAPGGPEEDEAGGFAHGGWSVNYWDEAMGEEMGAFMSRPFDLLLGRKTYDIFNAYWPHQKDNPTADQLNAARKYVASRTLSSVDWHNSELLKGDVAEEVRKLKQEDGPEIQVHGSGDLVQTLLEHGLVDEYHLLIFPVVIGTGKRLFGDGTTPGGLRLANSKIATTGVIMATYEPAGDIPYGTFAPEEPAKAG